MIKQAFAVFIDNVFKVTNVFSNIAYVSFNGTQDDATPIDYD